MAEEDEGPSQSPTRSSAHADDRRRRPRDEPGYEEAETDEDEEIEDRPLRRRRRRSSRDAARSAVAVPAIALMVIGSLSTATYLAQLVLLLATGKLPFDFMAPQGAAPARPPAQMVGAVAASVVAVSLGVVVIFGAYKMKILESRGSAITASIIAMLPCSACCLLGLPFGIWSLVVLNRPEVKDAFS